MSSFYKGDRVMADVAREYPSDYALGAVPAHVVKVPATVWDTGRDAGIGWLIVKLDETSDSHPQLMAEYVHIPADRCTLLADAGGACDLRHEGESVADWVDRNEKRLSA